MRAQPRLFRSKLYALASTRAGCARDVQDAEAARAQARLVELLADAGRGREEDIAAARGQPQAVVGRPAHVLHAPRPAQLRNISSREQQPYVLQRCLQQAVV